MSNFQNQDEDVPIGVNLLFESNGIEMADNLSINYINTAIEDLKKTVFTESSMPIVDLKSDSHAKALIGLALKVKTRTY